MTSYVVFSPVLIPNRKCCVVCNSNRLSDSVNPVDNWESLSLLSHQLRVIFVLRHILELPRDEVEKYLSFCPNPEEWIGFCNRCKNLVDNCFEVYQESLRSHREYNEAKIKIIQEIKRDPPSTAKRKKKGPPKEKKMSRFPSIAEEARQFVRKRNVGDTIVLSNPFEVGDRIAEELVLQQNNVVKVEPDPLAPTEQKDTGTRRVNSTKLVSKSQPFPRKGQNTLKTDSVSKRMEQLSTSKIKSGSKDNKSPFATLFHGLQQGHPPVVNPSAKSPATTSRTYSSNSEPSTQNITEVDSPPVIKEENASASEAENEDDPLSLGDEDAFLPDDHQREAQSSGDEWTPTADNDLSQDMPEKKLKSLEARIQKKVDQLQKENALKSELEDEKYWDVNDDDVDVCAAAEGENDAGALTTAEVTCPVCRVWKCPVNRGELLCNHLETCESKPPEEEEGDDPATLICPVCPDFKKPIADKIVFTEHIGACQGGVGGIPLKTPPPDGRIYECSVCTTKKYMKMNRFIIHYLHHKKKIKINCLHCPKKCSSLHGFRSHWYRGHPDIMKTIPLHSGCKKVYSLPKISWACPLCSEMFPNEDSRTEHLQNSHGDGDREDPFLSERRRCPDCGYGNANYYYSEKELQLHWATNHVSEDKFFYCDLCFQVFPRLKPLHRHKAKVHGEGLHTCSVCDKQFGFRRHLQNHMLTHNQEKKEKVKDTVFHCHICFKSLSTRQTLSLHLAGVHRKEVRFCCHICARPFFDRTGLRRHLANVHKVGTCNAKYYPCPIEGCNRKYSGTKALNCHLSWHQNQPQFQCSYCGMNFYFPDKLKRHELLHTVPKEDYPCECHLCPRRFLSNSLLRTHIRLHNGRKGAGALKRGPGPGKGKTQLCSVCNTSLPAGLRELNDHMREHHPDDFGKCPQCGKQLTDMVSLKNHIIHVHDRSYPKKTCEYCGKVYRRAYMARHYQQMHKDKLNVPDKEGL